MDRFDADYFDGTSSGRRRVEVTLVSGRAVVRGEGIELEYPADSLAVQPRLGSTPHRIQLPDGGLLVTQDAIERVLVVPRSTVMDPFLESPASGPDHVVGYVAALRRAAAAALS